MMDIENLIERLNQYSQSLIAYKMGGEFADVCMDAATALSTLQAENEKMRAELDAAIKHQNFFVNLGGRKMEIRPIDANALQELCNREIQNVWNTGVAPVSWAAAYADFKNDIDSIPTLTPPNEWISVEDEIPSDDDDGLGFFCMTNATGRGGGVLPLEWEVATIRGKTVRRWRWLNRISPWTVTHWMKRPAPPEKENSHE